MIFLPLPHITGNDSEPYGDNGDSDNDNNINDNDDNNNGNDNNENTTTNKMNDKYFWLDLISCWTHISNSIWDNKPNELYDEANISSNL